MVICPPVGSYNRNKSFAIVDFPDPLGPMHLVLPGIGEPVAYRLVSESRAVGKTLGQLNLRGRTGATVLAIQRGGESMSVPTAENVLRSDDVLALAGTQEAIAAAKEILEQAQE